ncbi:MAG: hypothetical protein ACYDG2_10885 [Ruminiclostridium sp.]
MKLGIVPHHDDARDCEEDLIAAVACWLGRDYELMFSESWGFSFSPANEDLNSFIGNGIKFKKSSTWSLLEKYHGISVNVKPLNDFSKDTALIHRELSESRPVLLNIDGFYCRWWDKVYQKIHMPHSCLIISDNESEKSFLCIDALPISFGDYLSKEEFKQGCSEIITFKLNRQDRGDFDWREIFNNAYYSLHEMVNGINTFDSIGRLGEQISNLKDLKIEAMEFEENLTQAPLFRNLLGISRGCRQFAIVLKYICTRAEVDSVKLLELAKQLELVGLNWAEVQAVLIKAYYMPNPQMLIYRMAEKIKNSVYEEKRIAEELVKLC